MNRNEIIESGILESYVLGATTPDENSIIQGKCKQFPELQQAIEAIELALMQYSVNSANLNSTTTARIKKEVLFQINATIAVEPKTLSLNTAYYKFGIAASLLLLGVSIVYNIVSYNQLSSTRTELVALNKDKKAINEVIALQKNDLSNLDTKVAILTDPNMKTISLKGMNSLADKNATVHFNTLTNEVYFNAKNLNLANSSKQYQLWAIVDGKPVDMGVIDTTQALVFQKMKAIKNAQAFAVTIENMGGSATPSLETMCLLGNV